MITDLDLDRVLASWLAEGTQHARAEDVTAALRTVERTRQRHVPRATRLDLVLRHAAGQSWLMAALVVGAVVGTSAMLGGASDRVVSASITAGDFPWAAASRVPDSVAFVALLPADAPPEGSYWRAATYDRFELHGWTQSDVEQVSVPSGQPLLGTSAEAQLDDQTAGITVTVRPEAFGTTLVSPGTPVRVDADAAVSLIGGNGWLANVEVRDRAAYTVEARLLRLGDPTVVSGDRLRQASEVYPPQLVERYTAVPLGALGPEARRLLATILASTPSHDPYDLAVAIETYLRDSAHFTYSTDLAETTCVDGSLVECFAHTRAGYCLQYASTMAILLRAALPADPIPTRLVQGFLPGQRSNGMETVTARLAHAWVEVYFVGYGWIPFDPTAGVGRPSRIPAPTRIP